MLLSEIGNSDLAERLLQVSDQIVRVLKADGQADQVGGHFERGAGHGGVGHGARMLDQGFHAAQGFGQGEHFGGSGELLGRFETGGDLDGDHAAETAVHLACRDVVARVGFEAWIPYTFHFGAGFEPLGHFHGVAAVLLDAQVEGFEASDVKPGVERGGHCAGGVLQEGDLLAGLLIVDHHGTADHVGVAADVLGGGVDHHIGAIGQRVDLGHIAPEAMAFNRNGTVQADGVTYQTAQPDIFAGGDVVTGPKFAIDAIAAGKEAAISLHRYVHPGQTLTAGRDRRVYKALDKEHVLIETADFDKDHRQMPGYNAAKAKTFSDARVTFTEEQVRRECARCLGCGATKVDSYLCIGCGLCTTKCKFDAIHLKKVRDWHAGSYETMPIKVAEGVVKRAGSIVKKAVSK